MIVSETPIRVGDELISINGKSCRVIETGEQATRILNHLEGIVSVVVATGRDGDCIESIIVKPKGWSSKTGVGLQVVEGKLRVLKIDPKGLWVHSLLREGDYVLSINACPSGQLDGVGARTLITSSETYVTIVAKNNRETNVAFEDQEVTTATHPRILNRSLAGFRNKNSSLTFFGPCFQKVWCPAKAAHILANVLAPTASVAICLGFGSGIATSVLSLIVSFLVVNLPWLGWKERRGSLCSVSQLIVTIFVVICCAAILPTSYHSSSLVEALARSIGIALPATLLANLPMYFPDDGMEHFAVSLPCEQSEAHEDLGGFPMDDDIPV